MKNKITWVPKLVDVKSIKPTPKNYKIKTDLGKQRLQASLKMFGLAGTVIVNTDLTLVDGNSRYEEALALGESKIWVSVPSKKLSPKEFSEMNAMYDFAKAGDVDMEAIQGDLGKTEDFYKKWNMNVPMELLSKLGKNAKVVAGVSKPDDLEPESNIKMINLFFSDAQVKEFRVLEEKFADKYQTSSTTDTVLMAMKALDKLIKNSKK